MSLINILDQSHPKIEQKETGFNIIRSHPDNMRKNQKNVLLANVQLSDFFCWFGWLSQKDTNQKQGFDGSNFNPEF